MDFQSSWLVLLFMGVYLSHPAPEKPPSLKGRGSVGVGLTPESRGRRAGTEVGQLMCWGSLANKEDQVGTGVMIQVRL